MKTYLLIAFLLFSFTANVARVYSQQGSERLPQGNAGIAARYPGDVGIEGDAQVVFVENFNDTLDSITARWESVQAKECLSLSSDIPANSRGKTSLLVTHTGGQGTGAHLYRRLEPGFDQLH